MRRTTVPVSFSIMRAQLGTAIESMQMLGDAIHFGDPELKQTRQALRPQGPIDAETSTALEEEGDLKKLLLLGTLPDISSPEHWALPSTLMRLLYSLKRCMHVHDVMAREMAKLEAMLKVIASEDMRVDELAALVASDSLGDPIGCICAPGTNTWHPHSRRFDLIAYEILNANKLRTRVGMQFVRETPLDVPYDIAYAWRTLLRNAHPYPDWEE
jgi:hypothetical protein